MIKSIILGIFQGITEFLPISSSGHLVVLKNLLHFEEKGITMEVFLHFGTLLSILVFFSKRIFNYFKPKNLVLIIIGSIPAGIIGLLFKDTIEKAFSSILFVIPCFILTGFYLYFSEKKYIEKKDKIDIWDAIIIGFAQGFAILPGISRSGWTTSTGILLGIQKSLSFEFSFILSIPALFGAFLLELKEIQSLNNIIPIIIGTIFSFISGLISIYIFSKVILLKKLKYFSIYLWFISALLILFLCFGLIH
uniref:Undecaprenyl-diphosphatase n=1 Tax=candidate division WOR-3 bacterium TaxID=2052148 RepID=A0A7C4Y5M9_UNCW3